MSEEKMVLGASTITDAVVLDFERRNYCWYLRVSIQLYASRPLETETLNFCGPSDRPSELLLLGIENARVEAIVLFVEAITHKRFIRTEKCESKIVYMEQDYLASLPIK